MSKIVRTPGEKSLKQHDNLTILLTRSPTDHSENKKLQFIAGDSLIVHVQGWALWASDKLVVVKSFLGV